MREKLETLPLTQLRELARGQGIKNVSGLRKSELVDRLCEVAERENAAEAEKLTARYDREFARLRVIFDDVVEHKRWKKKNRLPAGVKSPALEKWDNDHPAPTEEGL